MTTRSGERWERPRWVAGLVGILILSLLLGACSPNRLPDPTPGKDAVIGSEGFTVALDGVTVKGPAGVGSAGTGVHIKPADDAIPPGIAGVKSGKAFDISMDGGAQPQAAVTVSFALPQGQGDNSALYFVTKRTDNGQWEGLPVTIADGKASVTLTHFSFGWFGWADQVRDWFIDKVKQFLKVGFTKPACEGKAATTPGRSFSVSTDKGGVYACVTANASTVTNTIYSATPFVWRFRPTPGEGVGQQGVAPLELSGIVTVALFDAMHDLSYEKETVLVPGGNASITLKPGVVDTWTGARVDAGLGLVAVLIAGLDIAAAMASGQNPENWLEVALGKVEKQNDIRHAVECMAGMIEGSLDVGSHLGEVARTILSCTGDLFSHLTEGFISGVVGVVIGIVTSLAGLLVTQGWGLIGEFTGQNEVKIHVTSQAAAKPPCISVQQAMRLFADRYTTSIMQITCNPENTWAHVQYDTLPPALNGADRYEDAIVRATPAGGWTIIAAGAHGGAFVATANNPPSDMPATVLGWVKTLAGQ